MAPLVKEFQKHLCEFETIVCVTGQHREMLDQVLKIFDITPDYDLNIMQAGQDLYDVTARVLMGMREVLDEVGPEIVFVHGDTTTSMVVSLAAYYKRIAVAHVEAGLRTFDIYNPWPEELNRQITGRVAAYHFAPTELSKQNLILEGINEDKIFVTGNTVIDALHIVTNRIKSDIKIESNLIDLLKIKGYDPLRTSIGRKLVLITGHRRENFGTGFVNICRAIKQLAQMYLDVDFVYPMHLNPNVRKPIHDIFAGEKLSNVFFIEPLEYLSFVHLPLCMLN